MHEKSWNHNSLQTKSKQSLRIELIKKENHNRIMYRCEDITGIFSVTYHLFYTIHWLFSSICNARNTVIIIIFQLVQYGTK